MADDVLACADALGISGFHAFGHSMGGTAALLAERRGPGLLASAYFFEPIFIPAEWSTDVHENHMEIAARRRREVFLSRAEALYRYASKTVLGRELRADSLGRTAYRLDEEVVPREYYGRFDVAPDLSRPFSTSFLQVTPRIRSRFTYYTASLDEDNLATGLGISRPFFESSVEMRGPSFSRVFNTPGNFYSEKFKHVSGHEVTWLYRTKNAKPFVRTENGVVEAAPEETTDELCPKCGSGMVVKRGRFGKFPACSRYPECKHTQGMPIGVLCPEDGGKLVERRSRFGKMFYSCANYPDCKFAVWDKPVTRPCPQCGAPFLTEKFSKKTGPYIACYKKECGYKEAPKSDEQDMPPTEAGKATGSQSQE